MTEVLFERLDAAEASIRQLQAEVAEIRRLVPRPQPSAAPATGTGAPAPPARVAEPARTAPPARPTIPAPPARRPRPPRPAIDWADVLGARALAWAGGLVTLLGVVFLFVLAVNRGWIGPVARVGLGAFASALLVAAGVIARRRYGQLDSALAAVAAGIAGGYATLLAAAALYELVSPPVALVLAAGIAAAGVAIALAWTAQIVAGLGLVGATLVPVAIAFEGGLSVLGTAFAGLVFGATAVVAIRRGWPGLLTAGVAASLPQVALLVLQQGEGAAGRVVAIAAGFWLVYLASGLALRRRGGAPPLANGLVLISATVAASSTFELLNGTALGLSREGVVLLGVAAVYALLATVLLPRDRDASALVGAIGLAVSALGLAQVIGGDALAIAWSVQAALVAWLAVRLRELRYGAAALGYLVLAIAHTIVFEAPLRHLVQETAHPAAGAFAAAATAVAALLVAIAARRWEEPPAGKGTIAELTATFWAWRTAWVVLAFLASALLAVHAASLTTLELTLVAGSTFAWGQVAVTALWSCLAAALLVAGAGYGRVELHVAGIAWLGFTAAKVVSDLGALPDGPAGWSAAVFAVAAIAAAFVPELLADRTHHDLRALRRLAIPGSAAAAATAASVLGGNDSDGLLLLLAACGYSAIAAVGRLRSAPRDVTTLVGIDALGLGLGASVLLLDGTMIVAAWAIAALGLAWLSRASREPRLLVASVGLAGLAVISALLVQAPPVDLLVANRSSATGAAAIALAILGLLGLTIRTRFGRGQTVDALDRLIAGGADILRRRSLWAAGALALYGASLVILELPSWLGEADLTTEFQRGHTAVSAFWGIVGLVLVYLGLTRRRSPLRLAGFALFGVSLGKLFLYDLSVLTSVTRALSFLAVGAVLLVAGFFYQRLAQAGENGAAA